MVFGETHRAFTSSPLTAQFLCVIYRQRFRSNFERRPFHAAHGNLKETAKILESSSEGIFASKNTKMHALKMQKCGQNCTKTNNFLKANLKKSFLNKNKNHDIKIFLINFHTFMVLFLLSLVMNQTPKLSQTSFFLKSASRIPSVVSAIAERRYLRNSPLISSPTRCNPDR